MEFKKVACSCAFEVGASFPVKTKKNHTKTKNCLISFRVNGRSQVALCRAGTAEVRSVPTLSLYGWNTIMRCPFFLFFFIGSDFMVSE